MNEGSDIYMESFHLNLDLEIRLFHLKVAKKYSGPLPAHLGFFLGCIRLIFMRLKCDNTLGKHGKHFRSLADS
jgi:hypothetical protein